MRVNVIKRSRTSSGGDGLKHANAQRMGLMECASSVALARCQGGEAQWSCGEKVGANLIDDVLPHLEG